ncbi:glycosyltransferase family 10 domain-containing protein [Cognatishimia sp.]|uniref:glycosyltransferase family 10 domain-containing protein n=1 Tax=Cognatishimia sp. TaxID=2211648 RepID=UPI00351864C1
MMAKRVYVFTDEPDFALLKHLPPGYADQHGIEFSFGLDKPHDAEAVIFWNRSEISLTLDIPKCRTAYIAAESEEIRNISRRFFNQFGFVHSPTSKSLDVSHCRSSPCWPWVAGVDFSSRLDPRRTKDYSFFRNLSAPQKTPKVSIVTSQRTSQPMHRQRLDFIEHLRTLIPEHLEVFGAGVRPIDDKLDAIAPYQYHLALENTLLPDSWTEKIADPFLCWAHPFYVGANNIGDYFPSGSFTPLNIEDPKGAAKVIKSTIERDVWRNNLAALGEARERVLETHNAGQVLLNAAKTVLQAPYDTARPRRHRIYSDLSLIAEKKTARQLLEFLGLNLCLLFDSECEAKFWRKRTLRRRLRHS